jgi:2-polyprenyl-3-methyl-5-hydroxy-6-metoxy-1,4-benzoquinol methylase
MAIKEFHNLSELQLNSDPLTGTINSSWGNLGYWSQSDISPSTMSYPQACRQLACEVADMAGLNSTHSLLDTGFGCGDQLVVWLQEFKLSDVCGVNLSSSQTQYAQQKIAALQLNANIRCELQAGDCCQPFAWQGLDPHFDRIIALDCIYHFTNKSQYFSLCQQRLLKDGALVVTDLLLNAHIKNIWHKCILKTICYFSHIPFNNIKTLNEYQAELNLVGLTITTDKDISAQVFLPFGQWLKQYIADLSNAQSDTGRLSWLKYRGTAAFLRWAYQKNIFSYHVLRIEHNGDFLVKLGL